MTREVAVAVARFPDHALQGLQRRDLFIFVYPALQLRHTLSVAQGLANLRLHRVELFAYRRVLAVAMHKLRQVFPRIGK